MGKSRRHTPITGITTIESDKKAKRFARKGFRRQYKSGKDVQDLRETSEEYAWGKDGKQYHKDPDPKLMRK